MGCCVSTHDNGPKKQRKSPADRAPPPPSMEEETVKEVLSETPTLKPQPDPKPKPPIHVLPSKCQPQEQNPQPQKAVEDDGVLEPLALRRIAEKITVKANGTGKRLEELMPMKNEEISEQASDICSLSESVSISTATNITDDSGVHYQGQRGPHISPAKIQQSRARSFSGDMGARRDQDQSVQSQYRRPEQSPRRRNYGPVRPAFGGEPPRSRSTPRRRERDPGEVSARRSRSPAITRVENSGSHFARPGVGRRPSVRRTNQSPGRVRGGPNERKSRDLDGIGGGGGGEADLSPGADKQPDGNGDEPLDNPLVSLECFIFL